MSAFQIYVSIYAEQVPQDTTALMKYCYIVKELATLGANWKFYDENFRKLGESQGYHGIKFILNCGWGPIPFAPNQKPSLGNPRSTTPSFPKVTAGNSIEAFIAPDAPLSISVFDTGNHTPLPNVPSQNLNQVKGQSPAFPLSGALPTPVKVEGLAYYLEGYTMYKLMRNYFQVFCTVFVFVHKLAKFPLTFFLQHNTQKLLIVNYPKRCLQGEY